MKFAFRAITFIHFYLHTPHHKMPKHSRVTEFGTTELPLLHPWMPWMLHRSFNIRSPAKPQLPGTQAHAEQTN